MTAERAAERFGLGAPVGAPEAVARGVMGQVWSVTTATGRWAVKELFWGGDPASAARDATLQEEALAAGIHLPRPVREPASGAVIIEVDGVRRRRARSRRLGGRRPVRPPPGARIRRPAVVRRWP